MSAPSSAPLSRPLWPAEPALHVPPELLLQAQGIKVVFFDVDGVMTDGGLYIGEHGETLKRFHALDGHGLKLLRQGGVMPAVVTGRDSAALRHRLSSLGITHMRCGTEDKRPAVEALLQELGLQAGGLVILDPLRNAMMRYPSAFDGSKVRKDLARLLKASQVGKKQSTGVIS